MEMSISTLNFLMSIDEIAYIEKSIAENVCCNIYKENESILLDLLKQDIDKSHIKIDLIKDVMLNESNGIIKFATQFLLEEQVDNFSFGSSVLYTIYWIYLSRKTEKELLGYIKRRRIPQAKEIVKQLQKIYINSV